MSGLLSKISISPEIMEVLKWAAPTLILSALFSVMIWGLFGLYVALCVWVFIATVACFIATVHKVFDWIDS